MDQLLSGAIAMGAFIIALFFLRFWRSTGDRIFLYFFLSFVVQAGHRVYTALPLISPADEEAALHYLIRLLAYALILWGVLEKNLPLRRMMRDR